jgi:hypothetical protein
MTVTCLGDALFPSALPDVLGTLNTEKLRSDRLGVAPGRSGAGPASVRNVSLSKRLTLGVTKKRRRYGHRTQETRTGNCAASPCSRASAECA